MRIDPDYYVKMSNEEYMKLLDELRRAEQTKKQAEQAQRADQAAKQNKR